MFPSSESHHRDRAARCIKDCATSLASAPRWHRPRPRNRAASLPRVPGMDSCQPSCAASAGSWCRCGTWPWQSQRWPRRARCFSWKDLSAHFRALLCLGKKGERERFGWHCWMEELWTTNQSQFSLTFYQISDDWNSSKVAVVKMSKKMVGHGKHYKLVTAWVEWSILGAPKWYCLLPTVNIFLCILNLNIWPAVKRNPEYVYTYLWIIYRHIYSHL